MESDFRSISVVLLRESYTNPRRTFNEHQLQDLAESVREKGVLMPLLVRPVQDSSLAYWEIIAGARRFRAAKLAGLKEVPVRVVELDDKQALEVQVIENLQRADVHPVEEAAAFKELLEEHGYGIEDLATRLGKSERYVRQRLIFNQLAPEVGQAFEEGIVSIGHARLLGKLNHEQQLQMLKDIKASFNNQYDGPMTVRDLQRHIDREIAKDLSTAPFSTATNVVLPEAGPCTMCPKNSANVGKLFGDEVEESGKGSCLDRSCWDRKVQAHIACQIDKGLTQLSGLWDQRKSVPGVVSRNAWFESGDKKGGAKKGIVIDGYDAGKVVMFQIRQKNQAGGRNGADGESSADTTEAERRRSQKVASEFHHRIQEAIVLDQAERTTLTRQGLIVVALRLWSEAGQLGQKWLEGKMVDDDEDWLDRIAALEYFNERDYAGLCLDLIDLATLPHVSVSGYSDHSKVNDELATAAELLGVDYLNIMKTVQKFHADAEKEKAASKKAKARKA